MAFLYDTLKAEGRIEEHRAVAGRYSAIMHASAGAASVLGGWLATIDMRFCFWASAAAALAAAAVATTLREPPRSEPTSDAPSYRQILRAALTIVAERPAVRSQVFLGAAATTVSFLLLWVMLQPYAARAGLPVWSLGLIVLAVRGASIVGSVAAEPFGRRFGGDVVMAVSVGSLAVAPLVLAAAVAPSLIVVFIAVAFTSALLTPILSASVNRMIPSAQRATVLSIQSLVWSFLVAVIEPLLLAVADRAGIQAAMGVSAGLGAVILLPLLWLASRMPQPLPESSSAALPGDTAASRPRPARAVGSPAVSHPGSSVQRDDGV
jgi:MFS family permease